MLIKPISDIHTEFDTKKDSDYFLDKFLPNKDIDLLIVAGDLSTGFNKRIKPNLRRLCDRFPNVIYTLGNHDCWGSSLAERYDQLMNLDSLVDNLHFLENRRIEIDGKFFAGCAGWFPKTEQSDVANWIDFRKIEGGKETVFEAHDKSREFLANEVKEGDIVITHHLPCDDVVAPEWAGTRSNCWFVSGFDEIIYNNKPEFWIFGHTHTPIHKSIHKTEFFCNPRGYPREDVPFDKDLVIDTELGKID